MTIQVESMVLALAVATGPIVVLSPRLLETNRSTSLAPRAPSNPAPDNCAGFLKGDRDGLKYTAFGDERVASRLQVYRTKKWRVDESKLATPTWIGAIKAFGPGSSDEYPEVGPDKVACIQFTAWRENKELIAEASIHRASGGRARTLPAAICIHAPHHEEVRPKWIGFKTDCTTFAFSGVVSLPGLGPTTVRAYVEAEPGGTVTKEMVENSLFAFVQKIRFKGRRDLTSAQSDDIKKNIAPLIGTIFIGPGPWFPCMSNGCCRAY